MLLLACVDFLPNIFKDINTLRVPYDLDPDQNGRSVGPGPDVITFSCLTQRSTKFRLLIKTKIPTTEELTCFKSLRCCIYHAYKCLNANNC